MTEESQDGHLRLPSFAFQKLSRVRTCCGAPEFREARLGRTLGSEPFEPNWRMQVEKLLQLRVSRVDQIASANYNQDFESP
jgi:hypothetical protein